ncbi:hemerythrin domain-containing protein [Dechloromonas sp. HYN0024]|uniref:hemerythrin domain-containing protein n=1 Tax=Dechloromonas sp. HYN0024 TaxID=2231055 RepID=UPI0013C2E2AA|nr:hemerythrin domain-containing protein [Dechloromonas sp. HYN0024]
MATIGEDAIERMGRDHERMLALIERIRAACTYPGPTASCATCDTTRQGVCHGNIEQLTRSFVESTLKHILIESMLMDERVPAAHRSAHNQAHTAIARQLKSVRVVFSEDRNCVLAIEGIEQIHQALLAHFKEYDQPLEAYLTEPALPPYA